MVAMNIVDLTSKVDRFIAEKISPIDKKIIALVCILAFAAPAGAAYYFFINPKVVEITSLKANREHLRQEIELAKKRAADLPKFEAELKEVKKKFEEIAKLLPSEKEIPDLLRAISDLGQNAGLDFLLFKPGAESKTNDTGSFYAEIPLNINLSGPYHNMGYFLDQVSKLHRIVSIADVRLGSPKDERGEIVLQTTCNMKTYKQIEVTAAPVPGAK